MGFEVNVDSSNAEDYIAVNYKSLSETEEVYGMGLQYSVWNMQGWEIPLIVDEAGVGRGLAPITQIENA
jgi:hypothetical protein